MILKLTGVFEIHVYFKMIILKREQIFLNYTFNLKWWNYNSVFKEITKSFTFKYFQKTEVYLKPIQTSKMEYFVKIVNSLVPLTNLTKSTILDVWLGSKNASWSFNKSFCGFNIFSFRFIQPSVPGPIIQPRFSAPDPRPSCYADVNSNYAKLKQVNWFSSL